MSHRGLTRNEKDLGVLSRHHSRRDLPSHTKLKYREPTQNTKEDLKKKNYKRELEDKERIAFEERNEKNRSHRHSTSTTLAITGEESPISSVNQKSSLPSTTKKLKSDHISLDIDKDDPVDLSDDDDNDKNDLNRNSDDSAEDSEDETADLLAELNRLKKERAVEESKKEAENKAREEKIRIENILHGNPLNNKGEFKVKRRWDDDVVFKNCSRGDIDDNDKPFINDTLRSQFHRKFMEKYIR